MLHSDGLNTDKTEAVFEDGVLTLSIYKAEEAKPGVIKVKPKGDTGDKK